MARSKTAMWLQQHLQIRRELSWRKPMSINFRGHTTFPEAGLLQLLGTPNTRSCTRCQNGAGPFSQCVSFHEPLSDELPNHPADMPLPYGGSCANCHWNGQGSLCSLRPGGGMFLLFCLPIQANDSQLPSLLAAIVRPCTKAPRTAILELDPDLI
jgi:hypothetical protein